MLIRKLLKKKLAVQKKIVIDSNVRFKLLNDRERLYDSGKFGFNFIEKSHNFYGHISSKHIAEHFTILKI